MSMGHGATNPQKILPVLNRSRFALVAASFGPLRTPKVERRKQGRGHRAFFFA